MASGSETRPGLVDLGGVRRLAERAARTPRTPAATDPAAHPLLGPHWVIADHDWHRRRVLTRAGVEAEQTDHQLTRFALLPDARLVRSDRWRTEVVRDGRSDDPLWQGRVRALTERDVLVLDRREVSEAEDRGGVRTWGVRPSGETAAPWPGAVLERLLKALAR